MMRKLTRQAVFKLRKPILMVYQIHIPMLNLVANSQNIIVKYNDSVLNVTVGKVNYYWREQTVHAVVDVHINLTKLTCAMKFIMIHNENEISIICLITVNPNNNGASKVFFQNFCSKLIFKFDYMD